MRKKLNSRSGGEDVVKKKSTSLAAWLSVCLQVLVDDPNHSKAIANRKRRVDFVRESGIWDIWGLISMFPFFLLEFGHFSVSLTKPFCD